MPYTIWIHIITYTSDLKTIINLMKSNSILNEVCKFNLIWKNVFNNYFPEVFHDMVFDN